MLPALRRIIAAEKRNNKGNLQIRTWIHYNGTVHDTRMNHDSNMNHDSSMNHDRSMNHDSSMQPMTAAWNHDSNKTHDTSRNHDTDVKHCMKLNAKTAAFGEFVTAEWSMILAWLTPPARCVTIARLMIAACFEDKERWLAQVWFITPTWLVMAAWCMTTSSDKRKHSGDTRRLSLLKDPGPRVMSHNSMLGNSNEVVNSSALTFKAAWFGWVGFSAGWLVSSLVGILAAEFNSGYKKIDMMTVWWLMMRASFMATAWLLVATWVIVAIWFMKRMAAVMTTIQKK